MRMIIVTAILLAATTAACTQMDQSSAANDTLPADAAPIATPADRGPPLALAATDSSLQWGLCPPLFTTPGCEIAVLHGDPAQPNADIFLRVPGGYAIPPHRHTSAERMILASGELRVRYQGHAAATLQAGNYAYGPAGLPHEASCIGTRPCTLFIAFEGPVDANPVTEPIS
ncbi:MAG: cupin domain-containing protein [Pseudomonadota bacterium]|nr:cupin domain-containing protein [Pseudomonadota bacterium]